MKAIKKTSWQYRLIDFTFDQESKSTCGFHLETLVAILALPFTGYQEFFLRFSTDYFATPDTNYIKEKKSKENKWTELGLSCILFAFIYLFSTLITVLLIIPVSFILKTPSGELPCSTTALTLYSFAGMFVYPVINYLLSKAIVKLKNKFCSPITFID